MTTATARTRRLAPLLAGAAMLLAVTPAAAADPETGPTSSDAPYLVPVADGVKVRSILTAGDVVKGYTMAGIPDGMGVLGDDEGLFRLFVNHEIPADKSVVRSHGSIGAFVSEWKIDPRTLRVSKGQDLIEEVNLWDAGAGAYVRGITAFGRFCSADLPARSAFWDERSRTGYRGRILLNGEEVGPEGRAFAHIVEGNEKRSSYELPALGNLSFENAVANPATGRTTAVIVTDDATPGQVYLYLGTKQRTGNPVERAGLANGTLHGVAVTGVTAEDRTTGIGGATRFTLADLGDVRNKTGAQLQTASTSAGVTEFLRPEDAAWDPRKPRDLYFVTTDRFDAAQEGQGSQVGNSRLWRLRFDDLDDLAAGGTITLLINGTGANAPQMMDNITVDRSGHVLIQEDPGNNAYVARIWSYDIAADDLKVIAKHDPARFTGTASNTFNQDEESSGIIDASAVLGDGWFLLGVQAHFVATDPALFEGGQLLALYSPDSDRDSD